MRPLEDICPQVYAGSLNTQVHEVNQLVINWHLTEACNYSCRYCYSRWEKEQSKVELFQDEKASRQFLYELNDFFSPKNTTNPLYPHLKWNDLRLSLAGGETLLYPQRTLQVAKEAKTLGFKVSLITNGSLLAQEVFEPLFSNLSMLGISLDSVDGETCRQIGRNDKSGKILTLDDHVRAIEIARSVNPEIVIKINTVVNKFNADEDLTEVVEHLKPDRWKILRVLPVVTNDLAVSDQQFKTFVERHRHFGTVVSSENNQEMTESYLMVDPLGRFFQNQPNLKAGSSYKYSQPILQIGAASAFRQIHFEAEKFIARYAIPSGGVA